MALTTFQKSVQDNDIFNKFADRTQGAVNPITAKNFYNDLHAIIKGKASLVMNADTIGEGKVFNVKPYVRNLLLRTEEFDNAVWSKTTTLLTANATTAPDGTPTADKLIESTSGSEHWVSYVRNGINETLTFSCYLKAAERSWGRLQFTTASTTVVNAYFNLSTGQKGSIVIGGTDYTNANSFIEDVGGGWYRCSVKATKGVLLTTNSIAIHVNIADGSTTYTGDGTSGIYIWGAQLEKDVTYPSPYQKVTDGVIDFAYTRADSVGTVVNEYGLIEPACYNLLSRSEGFDNAVWVKSSVGTDGAQGTGVTPIVTSNYGIAPNGTLTADRLQLSLGSGYNGSAATNRSGIKYDLSNLSINSIYTESVYIKFLDSNTISAVSCLNAILNAGGSSTTQPYENVGNGWYKLNETAIPASATGTFRIQMLSSPTNTVQSLDILIWGAQLVQGSQPRQYLKTTDRLNVPRLDYSNGLPVSRTNLLKWSEEFDNSYWSKSSGATGATITANSSIAPDGTVTADKLVEAVTTSQHYMAYTSSINVISGEVYTYSIFVKAAERAFITLSFAYSQIGLYRGAYFNLTTKTATASTVSGTGSALSIYSIVDIGSGWFRLSMTDTIPAGVTSFKNEIKIKNADNNSLDTAWTGDGVSGFHLWGSQLERGSVATDYIKTTSQPETRLVLPVKVKPQLLLEPSRTNLFTYSNLSSGWLLWNSPIITQAYAASPIIGELAIRMQGVGQESGIYKTTTVVVSTVYTASFMIKSLDNKALVFRFSGVTYGGGSDRGLTFFPATNTFEFISASITSYGYQPMSDGWVRIWITTTSTSNATGVGASLESDGPTGCDTLVAGAQLEQGAYATSYIPTTSAAVTRAVDSKLSMNLIIPTGWNGYGVAYFEETIISTTEDTHYNAISDTATATGSENYMFGYKMNSSQSIEFRMRYGGEGFGGTIETTVPVTIGQVVKICIRSTPAGQDAFVNGVKVFSSPEPIVDAVQNFLVMDRGLRKQSIRRVFTTNSQLTDAECIEITGSTATELDV